MKKNTRNPPKKQAKAVKEKRSRWIQFMLYPENRYHMQFLDWCKRHEYGFYIVHDGESEHKDGELGFVSTQKDEKKKHVHCALYFENARTASAFIASLGTVEYWVVEENELGEPLVLSSVPVSDTSERTIVRPFLKYAEAVHDINAVAHYFIHDNFECAMLGKKDMKRQTLKCSTMIEVSMIGILVMKCQQTTPLLNSLLSYGSVLKINKISFQNA